MFKKVFATFCLIMAASSISLANDSNIDTEKAKRIKAFADSINIKYEEKENRNFVFNEKENINYEVLYFFSYSCPHCYEFKEYLNEWKKQKKDDVSYHPIPVSFQDNWEITSKAYVIAKQLKLNNFDNNIFERIHKNGYKMRKMEDLRDFFLEEYSIETSVFNSIYNSLETSIQLEEFDRLSDELEVMATPTLVLITKEGRVFLTSPSIANGQSNSIFSIEYLMIRDKKIKERLNKQKNK